MYIMGEGEDKVKGDEEGVGGRQDMKEGIKNHRKGY